MRSWHHKDLPTLAKQGLSLVMHCQTLKKTLLALSKTLA
jgi:hypothetical protein